VLVYKRDKYIKYRSTNSKSKEKIGKVKLRSYGSEDVKCSFNSDSLSELN